MRILFVISSLGIGGEQKVASILTREFIKKGHDVKIQVLSQKKEKQFEFDRQINIEYCKKEKGIIKKHLRRLKTIKKAVESFKPQAVIAFALYPSIYCSLLKGGIRVPVVISERNDPKIYCTCIKLMRFFCYRFADAAVFQTREAAEYFSYIPDKKKYIIGNPLDFDAMPDPYVGEREKKVVNTARLVPAKRQEVLIKAMERVFKSHPDYSLEIYGDGNLKPHLKNYIEDLGLNSHIKIIPATTSVLDKIKKASVFVLCSRNEGFPNSLAEALAIGVPSISTDCRIGGPAEMIKNNINGLLVPVDDQEELTKAILKLIQDKEFANTISKNAIETMKRFDKEAIGTEWLELLGKLVDANGMQQ